MKKNKSFRTILHILLIAAFLMPLFTFRGDALMMENPYIRIGLFFGSSELPTANLENSSGFGSGYRFGYYDDSYNFTLLGQTSQTQISMLKHTNIYLLNGLYYDSAPSDSCSVVGAYHIQLGETFNSYAGAASAASLYPGGFPAWIKGTYYVRIGAYPSNDAASRAASSLGVPAYNITGPSATAITVTQTKTTTILFQFDGGGTNSLVVMPGQDDSVKTVTWFKGNRYFGSFQYKRMNGDNLTVINILRMEDYVKGILPYEMSSTWPKEALKAQAVAARTYAACNYYKHRSRGFDLCNTTDCQVYRGINAATPESDRAVEETYNIYAWYRGSLAVTYYHSSDGGATESAENIWGTPLGHIQGVVDPYEAYVEDKINLNYKYRWSVTYTQAELTARLREKGCACSTITQVFISDFSPTGNPKCVTFVDSNGNRFPFQYSNMFSIFTTAGKNLRSYRFGISSGDQLYVNPGGGALGTINGASVLSGDGTIRKISDYTAYAITGTGSVEPVKQNSQSTAITVTGTGYGHNLGMSQYGAYSMAIQGHTYDQILKFYYTDITLEPMRAY
jgi:stage II sporulation protein D